MPSQTKAAEDPVGPSELSPLTATKDSSISLFNRWILISQLYLPGGSCGQRAKKQIIPTAAIELGSLEGWPLNLPSASPKDFYHIVWAAEKQ